MARTYPDAVPSLSSNKLTLNYLADRPAIVQRRVTELTTDRFVGEKLLTLRETGFSAVLEREDAPVVASDWNYPAAAGAEAQLVDLGDGTTALVHTSDDFVGFEVTFEAEAKSPTVKAQTAINRITAAIVRRKEIAALKAIKAASGSGTFADQTTNAGAAWTLTSNIEYGFHKAREDMYARDLDLDPQVAVIDTSVSALALGNEKLVAARRRETGENPVYTGEHIEIAGFQVWIVNNLLAVCGIRAGVVDVSRLGGILTAKPLTAEVIRNPYERKYRAQVEKNDAPFIHQRLAIQAIDTSQ